jgi:hypothetical protein
MVMPVHNKRIKPRYRVDNNLNVEQQLKFYLREWNDHFEDLTEHLKRNVIDIDEYGQDNGSTGIVTLGDQVRTPWMCTDILATWTSEPNNQSSINRSASVTSPAANQNLLSIPAALNLGYEYQAVVEVNMGGTLTEGTDSDNISLSGTGFSSIAVTNGVETSQQTFTYNIKPTANTAISLFVGGNTPTTGSVYEVSLIITPIAPVATLQLRDRTLILNGAAGEFQCTGMHGMQFDNHSQFTLSIVPALPCSLELMGYADYRKIDTA